MSDIKLGFDLTIEQSQKLVMTPELIQAIQILQFNTQELNAFVQEQLLVNPVLEQDQPHEKQGEGQAEESESERNDIRTSGTERAEREENDQKKLDELREIFRTADLVKFAKWTTLLGENDANLVAAIAYVEETKQEPDENAKPEPEVIKETDKERLNQVIAYRVVIILAAISSVALLAFIVYRLWDLLS